MPRFQGEAFNKNQVLVAGLLALAAEKGATAGQLALAWVLAKGENVVPIPGTKRRKYLEENTAAVEIKLTPSEVAELEAAIPVEEVAGGRYAEARMQAIDR
jgi:aryl-alcohol dehydrogenase-like predicted oxidoreductase